MRKYGNNDVSKYSPITMHYQIQCQNTHYKVQSDIKINFSQPITFNKFLNGRLSL